MLKKISLLAALAGIALFSACTEKGPVIIVPDNKSVDTTYLVTPPVAQARKVLVEEFTGASCTNCPAAREILANISDQNPGRLAILGIHIFGFRQGDPAKGAKYDFRTQDGTNVCQGIFGNLPGMPTAGIDRLPNDKNELLLYPNDWASAIEKRFNSPVSVNLEVSSKYNATTRTADIKIKATYLKAISGQQNISLCILEDDLIDKQEIPGAVIDEYTFKHVLRDFITHPVGIALDVNMPDKEAGRVFERVYSYKIDDAWKPEKCHIVAFIHNSAGTNKEVLQSAEAHLTE